jgi:RimJ/RimL family protein N-acetyltransferase
VPCGCGNPDFGLGRLQETTRACVLKRQRQDQEMVLKVREYSSFDALRDGRKVQIRALKPEDRADMLAAVGRTSRQSLYRRFFTFKRDFTEREVDFYVNIDFVNHVALVAVLEEDGRPVIVGGARYIVVQPDRAEIAFAVDDAHQGQGIGTALMRHLAVLARRAGLKELIADVLPENTTMLKVFETSRLGVVTRREPDAIHVVLRLS